MQMTVKNPKNKGNNFEREVARLLSVWSGDNFHRTPLSGALHWSNDIRVISDIVPSEELMRKGWPFSIECKNVNYEPVLYSLIKGTSLFWKHWEQACGDAKQEQLCPMLIFKRNNIKPHVAVEEKDFEKFFELYVTDYITLHVNESVVSVFPLLDMLAIPFENLF